MFLNRIIQALSSTALILAVLLSCSYPAFAEQGYLKDGFLVISRSMPQAVNPANLKGLGFVPPSKPHTSDWIEINRTAGTINLMQGSSVVATYKGKGINSIPAGRYEIMHKQRNASWYAPDSYFKSRRLPVPPEGSKERYLRGALGEFVLFVDKATPIHSGPVWTKDIGGVQLSDVSLSKIYYSLQVGSTIEVK